MSIFIVIRRKYITKTTSYMAKWINHTYEFNKKHKLENNLYNLAIYFYFVTPDIVLSIENIN